MALLTRPATPSLIPVARARALDCGLSPPPPPPHAGNAHACTRLWTVSHHHHHMQAIMTRNKRAIDIASPEQLEQAHHISRALCERDLKQAKELKAKTKGGATRLILSAALETLGGDFTGTVDGAKWLIHNGAAYNKLTMLNATYWNVDVAEFLFGKIGGVHAVFDTGEGIDRELESLGGMLQYERNQLQERTAMSQERDEEFAVEYPTFYAQHCGAIEWYKAKMAMLQASKRQKLQ